MAATHQGRHPQQTGTTCRRKLWITQPVALPAGRLELCTCCRLHTPVWYMASLPRPPHHEHAAQLPLQLALPLACLCAAAGHAEGLDQLLQEHRDEGGHGVHSVRAGGADHLVDGLKRVDLQPAGVGGHHIGALAGEQQRGDDLLGKGRQRRAGDVVCGKQGEGAKQGMQGRIRQLAVRRLYWWWYWSRRGTAVCSRWGNKPAKKRRRCHMHLLHPPSLELSVHKLTCATDITSYPQPALLLTGRRRLPASSPAGSPGRIW